jgi:hypothetical protein
MILIKKQFIKNEILYVYSRGCNLTCPLCPHLSYLLEPRNFNHVQFNCGNYHTIVFYGGETLAYRGLLLSLKQIKGKKIILHTNGWYTCMMGPAVGEGLFDEVYLYTFSGVGGDYMERMERCRGYLGSVKVVKEYKDEIKNCRLLVG